MKEYTRRLSDGFVVIADSGQEFGEGGFQSKIERDTRQYENYIIYLNLMMVYK